MGACNRTLRAQCVLKTLQGFDILCDFPTTSESPSKNSSNTQTPTTHVPLAKGLGSTDTPARHGQSNPVIQTLTRPSRPAHKSYQHITANTQEQCTNTTTKRNAPCDEHLNCPARQVMEPCLCPVNHYTARDSNLFFPSFFFVYF